MREFIRHPSDIPIEFSHAESDDGGIETLQNISRGGLSFTARRAVAVGEQLWIRIPGKEFRARARVAWCKPAAEGQGFDIGVTFTEQDDAFAMRMVEQVCHIEQYRQEVLRNEGRCISSTEAAHEWIRRYARDFPNDFNRH